ncbi:MAG: leucine--tRNA ligase [Candidatus Zambryskibacteria bacterium]|nr:leucine--tRNA ligase [Candidatus Zambryskibacteria bacterium]
MQESYNHRKIEEKWRKNWQKMELYKTSGPSTSSGQADLKGEKEYVLDMFPYPSGDGLHVGHPKGYIATDIYSRMKKMQGKNILHPMGFDAFGLPAENYAIKNKVHPKIAVDKNVKKFKEQLEKIGFNYDWDREINTTNPEYYRWTQWIFLKLLEKGLAYESEEPINWCPSCQTGLANEDLDGGKCERCGSVIEQKKMRQWVLKITDYADKLLEDLEDLDWPEYIKESQRNWIGKSEGALLQFKILNDKSQKIEVFTTRADTLFGVTYLVVAPEHELIKKILNHELRIMNYEEVREYSEKTKNKTEIERTAEGKNPSIGSGQAKTGVKIEGITVINPATGDEVPVFVADYVLGNYGTGAVMAVPAHDERDFEFAKKYNLARKCVIRPLSFPKEKVWFKNWQKKEESYGMVDFDKVLEKDKDKILSGHEWHTREGILINSGEFDGMESEEARRKITKKFGKKQVKYKLRDWVFSRQRYWGEPIPVVHCEKCGVVAVPGKDLPVTLPKVERYEPTGTGESPLANIKDWVNTKCPKCGGEARRETNTMPQWAGSSWYYLRYIDPKNSKKLVEKEKEKYWSPVDVYVGGAEHATRHLIYARFWHKFLFDIGIVNYKEPFKKLYNVGLILAEDGKKMSKRYNNVVNPDDIVETWGADTLRLYEMFMGPFNQEIAWNTDNMIGPRRFLEKIWKLTLKLKAKSLEKKNKSFKLSASSSQLDSLLHKTVKKVGEDIEDFKFNTAISTMMIFVNELEKIEKITTHKKSQGEPLTQEVLEKFLKILAPFAPHITEELWERLGNKNSIHLEKWPEYDKSKIIEEKVNIVVQINGKIRAQFEVEIGISENEAKDKALSMPEIQKWLSSSEIRKTIFVPNKIINFVV